MFDSIKQRTKSLAVKIIFGIIILVFVFLGVGGMDSTSSTAVATVNGKRISTQEFANAYNRQMESLRQNGQDKNLSEAQLQSLRQDVLRFLVQAELKEQEAKRLGIVATPQELRMVIGAIGLFQNAKGEFDPKVYETELKNRNISPGEFEEGYRRQITQEKLLMQVAQSATATEAEAKARFDFSLEKRVAEYLLFPLEDYAAKATVTDEELAKEYEQSKETFREPEKVAVDYVLVTPTALAEAYPPSGEAIANYYEANKARFTLPARYKSRQIFLRCPPDGSTEEGAEAAIAKAKALAATIVQKAKAGEDFAELARKHSEDPNTAPEGGDYGWLNKGEMPLPTVEEAALALRKNEISEPLRSNFGFHIIKLEDKADPTEQKLAEVQDTIITTLGTEKAKAEFDKIQTKAEESLAAGVAISTIAKDLQLSLATSELVPQEDIVTLLSLSPNSKETLRTIAVGKTAPSPLEIENGFALVHVKERKPSAIPPFADVRETLDKKLRQSKALGLARKAAEEALPAFAGTSALPPAYTGKTKQTQTFVRVMPSLIPLGDAPALATALLTAPAGQWLPSAYDTPEGAVIARVSSISPPAVDEWEKGKARFVPAYTQAKQEEIADAYMNNLLGKAKVEVNQKSLNSLFPGSGS